MNNLVHVSLQLTLCIWRHSEFKLMLLFWTLINVIELRKRSYFSASGFRLLDWLFCSFFLFETLLVSTLDHECINEWSVRWSVSVCWCVVLVRVARLRLSALTQWWDYCHTSASSRLQLSQWIVLACLMGQIRDYLPGSFRQDYGRVRWGGSHDLRSQ